MSKRRVLILDDDASVVEWLAEELVEAGFSVASFTQPTPALEALAREPFDLVISDVEMPERRGIDLLTDFDRARPGVLVVLITAFGSIDLAVEALRSGANDFVTKPFRIEAFLHVIERALRERRMRREIVRLREPVGPPPPSRLVASSVAMRRIMALAERIARSDVTVLVTGETGAGKGAVARTIHDQSARADGPFVQINAAALPAQLVEAELFGVRRGAFTDAREDRVGLFQRAGGGTLFLDEVGELPLEVQPKLLQALETRRYRRVGDADEQPVDLRIIAATNRDLGEAVREGSFRADLYYRLDVVRLHVPPLRDRPEDLRALLDQFLAQACARAGREVLGISEQALRWLLAHRWPGNVRELMNRVERAVILAPDDVIGVEDLVGPHEDDVAEVEPLLDALASQSLDLDGLRRRYIERVLERAGGNKSEAARILGIDRRTLYRLTSPEDDG